MSYKINGVETIKDSRQGNFDICNPGQFASAPGSKQLGDIYYNTTENTLYVWDGSLWIKAGGVVTQSGAPSVSTSGATLTTETDSGGYTWNRATWTSSGTITVDALSTDPDRNIVQYLVVGGGGAGG